MLKWWTSRQSKVEEPKFKVGDTVIVCREGHELRLGVIKHIAELNHYITFLDGEGPSRGGCYRREEIKKPGRIEELLYATSL